MNADIVYGMCRNVVDRVKKTENEKDQKMKSMGIGGLPTAGKETVIAQPNKLEGSFRTILEQRCLYPLYPAAENVPIEVQQIEAMTFTASPDVLITPSDLRVGSKVSI